MFFLCGCGPSLDYLQKKEQGLYPDTSNFPNTKWECREIDMFFCILDYEEPYIIGEYTVNDICYRVVGSIEFGRLDFDIYSSTQVSLSKYSLDNSGEFFVHCERVPSGHIYTSYLYENGTILCSLINYQSAEGENIPSTLTFDQTALIAQDADARWYAEELDMYIESFRDVDGYYKGEIGIDGKKLFIHAFEIGNSNYFMFTIENGTINNLRAGTTSSLIYMYFEKNDNKIVAKITDSYVLNHVAFPNWRYDGVAITFSRVNTD